MPACLSRSPTTRLHPASTTPEATQSPWDSASGGGCGTGGRRTGGLQSMMEIAEDIAPAISISYNGRKVNNLLRFQFVLHNIGSNTLEKNVQPLVWEAPGEIVKDPQVLETDPCVDLDLQRTKDSRSITIKWEFFNQGCKAVIEVICKGNIINKDIWQNTGNLKANVKHIPKGN